MIKNISIPDANNIYGVFFSHQIMENGELRFRLISNDGSSYIRTVSVKDGWQSAHFHKTGHEVYIVQDGWMVMATSVEGGTLIKRYGPGSVVFLHAPTLHNIYLPENAVIHTVKYGMIDYDDWCPSEELQEITMKYSKQDLEELPAENVITEVSTNEKQSNS